MEKIKGFAFFDEEPEYCSWQTLIFFKGQEELYEAPSLPINLFSTAGEAARGAQTYFTKFFDYLPHPKIARVEFEIPESIEEESTRLSEESELIILRETDIGILHLVGAPVPGCQSYCNTEVPGSLLRDNKLTPYFPTLGKSSYEIASDARSGIARQCLQSGIMIAKFSLRKCPDSERLIHYSE